MNKLFKNFMLALMLVPCVFAFTACGEQPKSQLETKATLNTDGNYETKTVSEVSAIINDSNLDCDTLLNGYKISLNMTMIDGEDRMTVETTMIQTFKEVKQGDQVISKTTTLAVSANAGDGQDTANFKMYYIDFEDTVDDTKSKEDTYFEINASKTEEGDVPNGKYKVKTASKFEGYEELVEMGQNIVECFNPDSSLVTAMLTDSNTLEVATNGNTKKIKITVPATANTSASVMYMVFENNVFQGFVLQDMSVFGMMTVSATLCAFNDAIDLPDFSGYSEF